MRRNDREITDISEINRIIREAEVCRMGLCLHNKPYIFPVNFGYNGSNFYIHSSNKATKLDIIKANSNVIIEIDRIHKLIEATLACDYTMTYESVIAHGKAVILENVEDKKHGLNIIMQQYSATNAFSYDDKMLDHVAIIKIEVEHISGKALRK